MAKAVFSKMGLQSLPARLGEPKLWHKDLHIGNIFVSDEDPTKIVSVIDWQSAVVAPLFCQVQFPAFIQISKGFTWTPETEPSETKLPDEYDQMDEDDQAAAIFERNQAVLAKMYHHCCRIMNENIYLALALPTYYPNLFTACRITPYEGVVPLRSCLLRIAKDWDDEELYGFSGDCPIKFTEDYLERSKKEDEKYQDYVDVRDGIKKILPMDSQGWIHPDSDFEGIQKANNELREKLIDHCVKEGSSPEEIEEIKAMWPW